MHRSILMHAHSHIHTYTLTINIQIHLNKTYNKQTINILCKHEKKCNQLGYETFDETMDRKSKVLIQQCNTHGLITTMTLMLLAKIHYRVINLLYKAEKPSVRLSVCLSVRTFWAV